jgi:hypothetical protein
VPGLCDVGLDADDRDIGDESVTHPLVDGSFAR